jgi:LysR family hydrogen peroxide-inducible transcriptional activator
MISMKHLRYFVALAQYEHFGRAAESCLISQPALSLQIKELEDLLGSPLLERNNKKIRLTPLGKTFAERASAVLQSVNELSELARASQAPFSGTLRLGMIPTVAPYLLPAVMKRLALDYPGVDLRPREAITDKLIRELNAGKLDAAVVALPTSEPNLTEHVLFDEEFLLVRHARDTHLPVPSSHNLAEMRLLLLEEGHCFRDQALSFCDINGRAPRDLLEGSSLNTLVQMVGAGIGVTLIPQMAVGIETATCDVSVSALHQPRPSRTIGMIWRKTSPMTAQLQELAELVGEVHAAHFAQHSERQKASRTLEA